MNDTQTIAVIIPAYNCAGYIDAALRSVESQTRRPDEVLVTDDGSTDETAARVQRFAKRSPLNVKLVRQRNRGIAAARNLAAAHSGADLMAFLDGDDAFYPEFLARTARALSAHPDLILCFSDRDVVDAGGRFMRRDLDEPRFREMKATRLDGDVSVLLDNPFITLIAGNVIPIGNLLVRRETFDAVGGFDEEQRAVEDRPFLLRLSRLGRFAFIDEPLGIWRRHAANTSGAGNALRMNLYADMLLEKVLREARSLRLDAAELAEVHRQRALMPARLLYAASDIADPAYPRLAARLLWARRAKPAAVAAASARYVRRFFARRYAREAPGWLHGR